VIDEPEEQAKAGAEDNAGDDGKVECGVFGFIGDVTGELSEAKGKFPAKVEKGADDTEDDAEDEE
jgi:hypothetical protein